MTLKSKLRGRQGPAQCSRPAPAHAIVLWFPLLSGSPSGIRPALLAGSVATSEPLPLLALPGCGSAGGRAGAGAGGVREQRCNLGSERDVCPACQVLAGPATEQGGRIFPYFACLPAMAVIAPEWELVWLI